MGLSSQQPAAVAGLLAYGLLLACRDAAVLPVATKAAAKAPPPNRAAPSFEETAAPRRPSPSASIVVQLCNA